MDLIRQYIVQCVSAASNNLRLSSEKIEAVAILKEHLGKCQSMETSIQTMKKMTALSKFAIKLDDVYKFISNSKIDFLKISDKFKEHSHYLIRDLSNMLDVVTPNDMKGYVAELNSKTIDVDLSAKQSSSDQLDNINVGEKPEPDKKDKFKEEMKRESELKEQYILEDLNEKKEIDFEEFERLILKPIKQFDSFLKKLEAFNYSQDELQECIEIMEINTELSEKIGFEIITNMQKIFTQALKKIQSEDLSPVPEVVESMRACLIVVVAVVKQKDVNITSYLNRAEKFGKMIFSNIRSF